MYFPRVRILYLEHRAPKNGKILFGVFPLSGLDELAEQTQITTILYAKPASVTSKIDAERITAFHKAVTTTLLRTLGPKWFAVAVFPHIRFFLSSDMTLPSRKQAAAIALSERSALLTQPSQNAQ